MPLIEVFAIVGGIMGVFSSIIGVVVAAKTTSASSHQRHNNYLTSSNPNIVASNLKGSKRLYKPYGKSLKKVASKEERRRLKPSEVFLSFGEVKDGGVLALEDGRCGRKVSRGEINHGALNQSRTPSPDEGRERMDE